MILEELSKDEYESFVSNHKASHFMKSYYFAEVMKYKNFIPHYIGLKKGGIIIASALLLEKKMLKKYSYFYCPRGFIIDYSDYELLSSLTIELKKYAKRYNALFIKIDPDIKRHNLDIDGNIDNSYNNYDLIENLKKLGYNHKGYGVDFEYEQPRFTFRLDLSRPFEEVYQGMHATTRNILNRNNPYGLELYIGNKENVIDFYKTMKETALRESIAVSGIKYYENFYNILNSNNMSDIYIVKCNIGKLKKTFEDLISAQEKEIDEIKNNSTKKTENKLKDYYDKLNKLKKDYEEVCTVKEDTILSSMITAKYKDKVWTVHGGNSTLLRSLNANYLLYYNIIKDAHKNGYKIIDFFGTSGIANPEKSNPIYGIHLFKKRLGGEYIEFIGEFDLVCRPLLYKLYNVLVPIRRKIVKAKLKKKNGN